MRTFTDNVNIYPALHPASRTGTAAGSAASGSAVQMQDFEHCTIVFDVGAISSGGSVALFVDECTAADGTGAQALAGGSVARFGTAGANSLHAITVKADQLSAGFTHIRGRAVVYVDAETALVGAQYYRYNATYHPVDKTLLASDVRVVS